ncbi:MAG: efflux RND transporter periplasmic adaptor subunit [Gemmatimonadaceae bacterium]
MNNTKGVIPLGSIHFVMIAVVLMSACDKSESKTSVTAASARADSVPATDMKNMKDMPGMSDSTKPVAGALPSSVTFTAAQIKHGGTTWGAVSMGAASGFTALPGEVIPNEDRTARLGAPALGRVATVSVRPGDHVVAGQSLVTLLSSDAGLAQSDVAKGDAEILSRRSEAQYAATARARADRLLALKAIPRQEYERAVADDERAKAALSQADAEATRAHKTADHIGAANSANGEITLRSPIGGVVLARTAVPGAVVEPGAPLVVVSDLQTLWLSIYAPESMVAQFHHNDRLRFIVTAFPADTFSARIDAVGAALESDTRTLSVRAVITNTNRLKPQMLATVLAPTSGTVPTAIVPDAAIQLIQGRSYVFLVTPDDKGGARFEKREVVLGTRSDGRVEVIKGLVAGDVVVTAGSFAVKADFLKGTMSKMEM